MVTSAHSGNISVLFRLTVSLQNLFKDHFYLPMFGSYISFELHLRTCSLLVYRNWLFNLESRFCENPKYDIQNISKNISFLDYLKKNFDDKGEIKKTNPLNQNLRIKKQNFSEENQFFVRILYDDNVLKSDFCDKREFCPVDIFLEFLHNNTYYYVNNSFDKENIIPGAKFKSIC